MIVRQLIHVERVPCGLILRFDVASEYAVPEIELLQLRALSVAAPNNTDVQHIEMITRKAVHATVVVVMTIRHDHADDVVIEFWLDMVLDILIGDIERMLFSPRLNRLVRYRRNVVNIAWDVVPVPERHQQPDKADDDKNICEFHPVMFSKPLIQAQPEEAPDHWYAQRL